MLFGFGCGMVKAGSSKYNVSVPGGIKANGLIKFPTFKQLGAQAEPVRTVFPKSGFEFTSRMTESEDSHPPDKETLE
jgi:hypothetical protein